MVHTYSKSVAFRIFGRLDGCARLIDRRLLFQLERHFEDASPLLASREEAHARRDDFLGVYELRLGVQDGKVYRLMRQAFELCHRCEELVGRELPARWEEKIRAARS